MTDYDAPTAEGSTGAPLRQQIADVIHNVDCRSVPNDDGHAWDDCPYDNYTVHADAVVALLNLTEERQQLVGSSTTGRPGLVVQRGQFRTRYVTPWLPSTPPDTSSSETT